MLTHHEPTTAVLVVAAGKGERFGNPTPKQYLPLEGKAILRWTVEALLDTGRIGLLRVVTQPEHLALYHEALGDLPGIQAVAGGETRQESVRLGLESLVESKPRNVLIHDAVRPFFSTSLVDALLEELERFPAAVPLVPVTDTIKTMATGMVGQTLPRASLYAAQTPQAFQFDAIMNAHRHCAGMELTDDAAVMEAMGTAVRAVPGDMANFKITTPEDMARAKAHLEQKNREKWLQRTQVAAQHATTLSSRQR